MDVLSWHSVEALNWKPEDLNDERSCTVWATAVLLGYSLFDAYLLMHDFGRTYGKGLYFQYILESISLGEGLHGDNFEGHKVTCVQRINPFNSRIETVGQAQKRFPRGKYFIITRGHVLAMIDGVVYDHPGLLPGVRRRARFIYELEEFNS